MRNILGVEIIHAIQYLLVEYASHLFRETVFGNDVVEKLSSWSILHDEVDALRILNYFVELHKVWVVDFLQDFYFSHGTLDVSFIFNPRFF